ncbi:hypothetical protein CDAR_242381 [Caerostris darwini]|uniref:Uncharacterized protein n=1 Tax=Caerostris darwini TaxID=1538125 RepID=A0AAV4RQY3_9ARAC|nr:hypothetical protein CDAR_242381 [Caerostris darwini]
MSSVSPKQKGSGVSGHHVPREQSAGGQLLEEDGQLVVLDLPGLRFMDMKCRAPLVGMKLFPKCRRRHQSRDEAVVCRKGWGDGHHVPREERAEGSFSRRGWANGDSRFVRSPSHGHKIQGAVGWDEGKGFTLNRASRRPFANALGFRF